jgi:thioredoxin reductase (NADPH)
VEQASSSSVLGDGSIEGVRLKDTQTGEESTLEVKGLFVAIGHTPATKFLQGQRARVRRVGLHRPQARHRYTNIEGVFAAGDVADADYRQAITAAGMGCQAALDAERWLGAQGLA